MYRLLIADDEALEREGLELIVNKMMPGQFTMMHAENGRKAIEKAEEFRPHVVLMDIKMPGIHGLDALKEIKAGNPGVKMVLVTAYEQFEYAKQAFSLGVKDYLTKPVRRDEIIHLLARIVQELEAEKNSRQQELAHKENNIRLRQLAETELALNLMTHAVHPTDISQLLEMLNMDLETGCAIVAAFPDFHLRGGETADAVLRDMHDTIRDTVKLASVPVHTVVSPLIDRHMTVFVIGKSEDKMKLRDEAFLLGGKLAEEMHSRKQLRISVGIGSIGLLEAGLRRSYYEAVFASASPTAGNGRVALYGELPVSAGQAETDKQDNRDKGSYVQMAIERIREERDHQTHHLMDKAADFIRGHFREELSLEQAAEHVHLNPYYFSKLFKQYIGESFIDFITRIRIEEAQALITEGRLSLKEISYSIGYKDPNYFSRVFKKVAGLSPSEYRSQQYLNLPEQDEEWE
ncbi:response regulator transcription factor [Paenibacillus protaetiae]|uniref:Response regulator n=1 Tax=Paenibacillus protaetiae TaxID=2509456 RepID=A0A4P6FCH1_9BACL|nr:response regulator [Paenibacillus protaetiae]QAY68258.1 response regulator [Paenibacillus protaetiae]